MVMENHRPVYCRDCKGQRTFERFPKRDAKGMTTDAIILECWKCRICGHLAWVTARS